MYLADIPELVAIRFGEDAGSGYIRPTPVASQIGVTAGAASFTDGFPPSTFTPLGAGGAYVNGEDMNGVLNFVTAWNRWQAAGGPAVYDAGFCTSIDGYPKGAALVSTAYNGKVWFSTVDGNLTDPDGGSAAGWTTVGPTLASGPQALAGTDDVTYMSPLKTRSAIQALLPAVATLAEARTGTNNTDIISSLILAQLFASGDGQTFTLPGGFTLKFGSLVLPTPNTSTTSRALVFATPFPTSVGGILLTGSIGPNPDYGGLTLKGQSLTVNGALITGDSGNAEYGFNQAVTVYFLAWGR